MTMIATFFPLGCWLCYGLLARLIEMRRPSLSIIMSIQRRRWVANAAQRESPLDAILSANLMGSVSFLASTSVLVILGVFTAFGQLPALRGALAPLTFGANYTEADIQVHLVATLALFVLAFFAFTLSLRQFNHFCIMIGAMDHRRGVTPAEIDSIAALNTMGARNFNNGLRAYYFSIGSVAWFSSSALAIGVTIVTVLFLIYREFYSSAHRLAASATVVGTRPDPGSNP